MTVNMDDVVVTDDYYCNDCGSITGVHRPNKEAAATVAGMSVVCDECGSTNTHMVSE